MNLTGGRVEAVFPLLLLSGRAVAGIPLLLLGFFSLRRLNALTGGAIGPHVRGKTMIQPIPDRHAILGALAVQLNLLTAESLAAAHSEWQTDSRRSLGEVLVARGLLAQKVLIALETLVESQLTEALPTNAPTGNHGTLDPDDSSTPSADPFATRLPVGAEEAAAAPGTTRLRYRVLRLHARGGLGEVFVALDEELQREVALKEIQTRHADNAESRQRFLLEAEVTGRLEHPGIVPVYGLGASADGRPFYAMRFIKGDSLKDASARFHADAALRADAGKRGLELRQLLGRFVAVCNAIAYAHSKGILHRDLKPDNVMLGKYGETLVVDWGLATVEGLTVAGSVLGTPQYMSPEQATGQNAELGPASDVYSLGATLYHLLTGKAPFSGGDTYAILERVVRGLFPPPRAVDPSIPAALEAICQRAMALRPEDRYGSAKELADDVERWLSDEPVVAYAEPLRLRLGRWRRRHPALVTGTAALVFAALVALGVGSLLLSQEQARTLKEQQEKLLQAERARQAQAERAVAEISARLSEPQPFPALLPLLRDLGDKAVGPLQAELERKPGADWTEGQREAVAQRQAHAAVALLHLGQTDRVWPLLQNGPYPDVRTYLLHRAGPLGVEARLLCARLSVEQDASARQALILALGEYPAAQLPAALRQEWTGRLLRWYRDDPDPGVHAAVDWLLRHSKEGPEPRKCDWGQAAALQQIDDFRRAGRVNALVAAAGRRWYVNGQGQTMVLFPGPVEFWMGSPKDEAGRWDNEVLHRRRIGRNFALASKKVTVAQFQRFLTAHPEVKHNYDKKYSPDADGPIVEVTWYEAAQYCRWLSEREGIPEHQMCYPSIAVIEKCKDGKTPLKLPAGSLARTGYRLPSEAEWEYACRAGSVTSRCYGSAEAMLRHHAWYTGNAGNRAWPVGQKKPNAFGLFDMHGNAWEWCQNRYTAYKSGTGGKPAEDEEDKRDIKDDSSRVMRGGAFYDAVVRSAFRGEGRPANRNDIVGLRVARTCH